MMGIFSKYLLVDDDMDDLDFFCEVMEVIDPSAACYTANNGKEALELLDSNSTIVPDIIFMDLNMSKMDGKSCLKILKSNSAYKHIPVVILTTSSNLTDKEEVITSGASYFLTKPTSMNELHEKVLWAIHGLEERAASMTGNN